ncbi:MAG: ClpXP protease specificity-enhancing factor [Comamonadaceae bacterium]|nr:MAG: ClpXP protease specificity-enhancing factor [Comamonadaceae bacterium]
MINAIESTSTRPYLIRALYEWCTDNGLTPYVAVQVDETVQVPREYVKNGEIVLNISFDATSSLTLGNDFIEFKARFAGTAREIQVPISRVIAIYARENGQGMAFPASAPATQTSGTPTLGAIGAPGARPALRDASRGEGDGGGLHLVTADETSGERTSSAPAPVPATPEPPAASDASTELPPDEPPRPPAGGGPRPALKRVK